LGIADAVPAKDLLSALVALLVVGTLVPPGAQAVTVPDGDWYISENVLVEGENITLKGNLYILDGASLTLNGSSLNIPNDWKIKVERGGRLDMYDSHVTAEYSASWWKNICILGNSTMEYSMFDGLTVRFEDGARAFANKCEFNNSYMAIEAVRSSLNVLNYKFVGIRQHGIGLYGSDANILGCRFFRTASDEFAWSDVSGNIGTPQACMYVSHCRFKGMNSGYGVRMTDYSANYYSTTGIYNDQYGEPQNRVFIDGCCFSGLGYGVQVLISYPYLGYGVQTSTFDNLSCAIDFYFTPVSAEISSNIIRNCPNGIKLDSGGFYIENNEITGCANYAINDHGSYYYNSYSPNSLIDKNIIVRCGAGISLSNFEGTLTCNTFRDCRDFGFASSRDQRSSSQLRIRGNLFNNCSRPTDKWNAAVVVTCINDNAISVEDNDFVDNRGMAIWASGMVAIDNNRINGSRLGILLYRSSYPGTVENNIISGGITGIDLGCQADVVSNKISDVAEGIRLSVDTISRSESYIAMNIINVSECGIRLIDRNESTTYCVTLMDGNRIAAGKNAISLEGAHAQIQQCTFKGTQGYCIYALGSDTELLVNDWGSTAEGILKQEWFLTISGQERTGADWSGPWVPSDGADVAVRDPNGALAFEDKCGNGGRCRTNLTEYIIALNESRTDYSPYNITLLKPMTGMGKARVELVNNTNTLVSLFPLPDLALEFLELPSARPPPDELVPVNITVLNDATYMPGPRTYSTVKLILTDNGDEVNQRIISNIFWGEWCNVTFMWKATEGHHVLEATIDPDKVVEEVFEDNNRISLNVSVNVRPQAAIGADRSDAVIGDDVLFTANGSWDDSGLAGFVYDFGDGSQSGWTEDAWAVHRYLRPGCYEPRLMVRDRDGATSEWSTPLTLTVTGRSLDIGLSADRNLVDSLVAVTFSASARNMAGNITDYLWDFGDGSTDYGRNASRVEHVYRRPGAFSVSVRMTDSAGSNGTATLNIVVRNRPPVASFTFSPDTPTVLTEVSFGSTSTDADGSVVRWLWDLGDGTQSWGPAPTHLYLDDGCYTVILAVLDDSGSWSSPVASDVRLANLPPKARAALTPQPLRVGQLALFDGNTTADPDDARGTLMFCWSSQDGWRSEGPKLSRRFDAPGKYVIRLTVTDDDGAQDSVDISFEVKEKGTIVPGLDHRPAALGLIGLAALMFFLTFIVWRKVKNAAPSVSRPSQKKNGRPPPSGPPPGR